MRNARSSHPDWTAWLVKAWRSNGGIGDASCKVGLPATMIPRIVRFRDAPKYLGMDRNRFNTEVRPHLTEIPIGKQGIGFDRLELDAWADQYIARNGRPARKGVPAWDASEYQASSCETGSGISISASSGGEFAKALAHLNSTKRNGNLPE